MSQLRPVTIEDYDKEVAMSKNPYTPSPELDRKMIKIITEICWLHGEVAGGRMCQDWSSDSKLLDDLTPEDKNYLMWLHEQSNSNGEDFEADWFPYDEMVVSFVAADYLIDIYNKFFSGGGHASRSG